MKIAFYAPMKSPAHPTPSGDRHIAQALIKAFECCGHEVEVVSEFRSWEGRGDGDSQQRIASGGEAECARCLERLQGLQPGARPAAWFSYHVYHKSPDYLGPEISRALDIPYIIAEASHAPEQAGGCWKSGHQRALACIRQADALIALNSNDIAGLRTALRDTRGARITPMKPFLVTIPPAPGKKARASRRRALAKRHGLNPEVPWLITVAMMRPGDKLSSYKLLARALFASRDLDWQLLVIGDGTARAEVEACYAATLGRHFESRVVFTGRLEHAAVVKTLAVADLFAWPALREALGMAMLEAQCCGLPVVAEQGGGVADLVRHRETGLLTGRGHRHKSFADGLRHMLEHPEAWREMGRNARRHARSRHGLDGAARTLNDCLVRVTGAAPEPRPRTT